MRKTVVLTCFTRYFKCLVRNLPGTATFFIFSIFIKCWRQIRVPSLPQLLRLKLSESLETKKGRLQRPLKIKMAEKQCFVYLYMLFLRLRLNRSDSKTRGKSSRIKSQYRRRYLFRGISEIASPLHSRLHPAGLVFASYYQTLKSSSFQHITCT